MIRHFNLKSDTNGITLHLTKETLMIFKTLILAHVLLYFHWNVCFAE